MNTCTSQIIQMVLPTYIQHKQDMSMPEKNDNISDNFGLYENGKSTPKAPDIEGIIKL